jgi:hypothetical protein
MVRIDRFELSVSSPPDLRVGQTTLYPENVVSAQDSADNPLTNCGAPTQNDNYG